MPERVTNFLITSRCSVYLLKEKINFETQKKKKTNEQRKLTQPVGQPASQSKRKCEKKNKIDCDNEYIYNNNGSAPHKSVEHA